MSYYDYDNLSERQAANILITCWSLVYLIQRWSYKAKLEAQITLNLLASNNYGWQGGLKTETFTDWLGWLRAIFPCYLWRWITNLKSGLKSFTRLGMDNK